MKLRSVLLVQLGLLFAAPAIGGSLTGLEDFSGHLVVQEAPPAPPSPPSPRPERPSQILNAKESPRREGDLLGRSVTGNLTRCWEAHSVKPARTPNRLADCAELTKPDSIRIFLFATPQNHRSPPA